MFWTYRLPLLIISLLLGVSCHACTRPAVSNESPDGTEAELEWSIGELGRYVVALGVLMPEGEVIKLSVPNAEDSRVNRLLVSEGDFVLENQVIAVLQGFDRRERDLEAAQKNVELQQARLDHLLAGEGSPSERLAKQAEIAELEVQQSNDILRYQAAVSGAEADLKQAELTYERNRMLASEGALSQAQLDQSAEALAQSQAQLVQQETLLNNARQTLAERIEQEKNLLATLSEVRPTDIAIARTELEQAEIAVEQRRADLEETQVRVPVSGQILRINTRVGEQVNTAEGIVELGNTQQMIVVAEIYETDVTDVTVGQKATISSEYGGFEGSLQATVEHIGLQIGTRSLAQNSTSPLTDENQRIVRVRLKINPEDSDRVAQLTNMQVRVEIETDAR